MRFQVAAGAKKKRMIGYKQQPARGFFMFGDDGGQSFRFIDAETVAGLGSVKRDRQHPAVKSEAKTRFHGSIKLYR
jgi:hypothetical protein